MLKEYPVRNLCRKLAWRAFQWSENLNNSDIACNGEEFFLSALPSLYSGGGGNLPLVFFDVGANVGDYSKQILRSFPEAEVHLFDPSPECAAKLRNAFSENGRVFINECAVSDNENGAVLFFDFSTSGLASLYKRDLKEYGLELNNSISVKTVTLESYIREKSISHINLMKMDIEGHEVKALEGVAGYLNIEFIDFIQFEYGGCNLDSMTSLRALYRLLEERGFTVCKVMPGGLLKRKYFPFMENYQYSNFVAASPQILS